MALGATVWRLITGYCFPIGLVIGMSLGISIISDANHSRQHYDEVTVIKTRTNAPNAKVRHEADNRVPPDATTDGVQTTTVETGKISNQTRVETQRV